MVVNGDSIEPYVAFDGGDNRNKSETQIADLDQPIELR